MPLRSDILDPIPGDSPGGENLRYAPIYDKIKEARREDDDAIQGDWARERKVADWPLTIKLISEALATKSKDLQLAAWLTEALLRKEGLAGLKDGLDLQRAMLEQFWDSLWPEIEDGDAEFRATPLQWVGDRLEQAVKRSALTRNKLDWFQYKESRTVGYEDENAGEEKRAAREQAIADGKITAELFDAGFNSSPKAFYVELEQTLDTTLESLEALGQICDEKFGDVSPNFGKLRGTLEEVRQTVHILLVKKRETEPDEPVAGEQDSWSQPEPEPATPEEQIMAEASRVYATTAAAAPARAPARTSFAAEPADREDAVARVASAARYIRREDPYSPAPYLMLRGLRWGELRANGESIDASMLAAPPTEIRQELKRLASESLWTEVLEAAETAMEQPCGRGWLDIHRYVWKACYEQGSYYDPISTAVRSELRALLADFPGLTEMTLQDDTPTANAETMAWIREHVTTGAARAAEPAWTPPPDDDEQAESGADAPPDAFDLALQAVHSGNSDEGIAILTREVAQERSPRARFNRKVQLARLCLAAGYENIALPILRELDAEIQRRRLEDWEAADVLAHPLVLLYRCLGKVPGSSEEEMQKLYARICCLDPVQALACSR
ncbi:MAG TPA: type VI secretion system protein TssA [Bryobacteraceae bacterium]|nr:type VI secretion system protein TssA [Bryobacteraceae bacterium]